ncbi:response regulator [Micromonospora sp. DT178]|uniref:response regulator n=1 Tax=Micromonospora sp. DT178 TaxID=3393436 RepID=UPI003CEF9001
MRRDPGDVADGTKRRAVTVVLADAQPVVRRGLHALLSPSTEVTVVAEAGTTREAMRSAASLRPDVLVLDIELPGFQVGVTLQEIARMSPTTAVLVFTARSRTRGRSSRLCVRAHGATCSRAARATASSGRSGAWPRAR